MLGYCQIDDDELADDIGLVDVLSDVAVDLRGAAQFMQNAATSGVPVERDQLIMMHGLLTLSADAVDGVATALEQTHHEGAKI